MSGRIRVSADQIDPPYDWLTNIALLGIPVAKDGRVRSAAEMYSRFDVTMEQFKKVR